MDKDRVKGKVKDISGRAERKAGEWTGNKDAQTEGARKQVEGKVQNIAGKAKDAARDIKQGSKEMKRDVKKDMRRTA
jgi:uncharacterized protein YjbJ (UPF0337 family)